MQILSIDGIEVRDYKHDNVIKLFQEKESLNLIVLPSRYRDVSTMGLMCTHTTSAHNHTLSTCVHTRTYIKAQTNIAFNIQIFFWF